MVGFRGAAILPIFDIQVIGDDDQVWLAMRLVEILVPIGSFGRGDRVRFLRDRVFTPGVGVSTFTGERTELAFDVVRKLDWLKGTVAYAYGLADGDVVALARKVAVKDHVAQRLRVHPATLEIVDDGSGARDPAGPVVHRVRIEQDVHGITVHDAGGET